jgi:hypothetical protein
MGVSAKPKSLTNPTPIAALDFFAIHEVPSNSIR